MSSGTGQLIGATNLSKSANEFAIDLFQTYLKRHGDKYINLLLCPYLIYHSLAMMLVGAKGPTAQQLIAMLRIRPPNHTDESNRHREFLMLTEQLIHGNHDFVHLASFIYLDKSCKRTELFKNVLRDFYETKPKKIEFDNVDATVKTINEDVARTTENIYNDILSEQEALKLEKSMLLVNAVFFRGFWLSNFTEVKKAPFVRCGPKDLRGPYQRAGQNALQTTKSVKSSSSPRSPLQLHEMCNAKGSDNRAAVHQVNMMSKLDYLAVLTDEQLDARVIKMPFEASDLQMLIILPNDKHDNSAYLCERISAEKIEQIYNELSNKTKVRAVRVTMPVFCIDSGKISLQSTLIQMGAKNLFDKELANMTGVCENKQIWLNKILHRCFIICDNRGSITSSTFEKARRRQASGVLKDGRGIEEFLADHPFMYIIMDSVTKAVLIIGLYTDPCETLEVIHENQLSDDEAHQIYTEGVYKT